MKKKRQDQRRYRGRIKQRIKIRNGTPTRDARKKEEIKKRQGKVINKMKMITKSKEKENQQERKMGKK